MTLWRYDQSMKDFASASYHQQTMKNSGKIAGKSGHSQLIWMTYPPGRRQNSEFVI
jgi:hypothetical protein